MDDRPRRADEDLVGPLDELGAALGEDLDGDVVGDEVTLDEAAHEVEVGLRRRREADLDLLEAHGDEGVEHLQLAGWVHRVDQRLVAVPEVHRAPLRRRLELDVRPAAVRDGERQRSEGHVPVERHLRGATGFGCHGPRSLRVGGCRFRCRCRCRVQVLRGQQKASWPEAQEADGRHRGGACLREAGGRRRGARASLHQTSRRRCRQARHPEGRRHGQG